MNWTYDPNLTTPSDRVRFKIGDTTESSPLFADEELEAILAKNANDVLKTCIELMRSLVRRYARMVTVKADDVSKEAGKLYTQYREQLDDLLLEQRTTSGTTAGGQLGGAYLKTLKPKLFC